MLWPLSAANAADPAPAADATPPDTSQWKCESCPFEKGTTGSVNAGVGYVSQDSAKFGEYTGLNEKGAYLIADGEARYRGEDATYLNAAATDLGLRSRWIGLQGGRQGQYGLWLNYDELPHFITDTAQTPFLGAGGNFLTLPPGYPAPSTRQMPLSSTLQDLDLDTQRKALGAGGSWLTGNWELAVNYRHEKKDGMKRTAGSFFINAAQLPAPVDYTTDQIDASVGYNTARWQLKLSYYGSIFRDDNEALTWQNPFTFPAGVSGQLALPPGNEFHQIRAAGEYQFSADTRASADIAWGRGTQNEGFLAPTLNTSLAVPALPSSSLNGRVNTFDANVKLSSLVTQQLRLNAAYVHNDRDNDTPQATYAWVSADTFVAQPRMNLPYSFTQDKVKLAADYRPVAQVKGTLGYDYDQMERTNQEVDTTRENTIWGKLSARPMEKVDLSLKLAYGERNNSGYNPVPQVTPPENPLMRKYNMADRRREGGDLRADIAVNDRVSIGLDAAKWKDKYTDSTIGLTSGDDMSLSADLAFVLSEQITAHAFGGYEEIKSQQVGSQSFSTPDWTASNKDTIDYAGVGLRYAAIKDTLDLGADYMWLSTRSAITVDTGATSAFPDMTTTLDSFRIYADYRLNPKVRLYASYWYERYRSTTWLLDNVTPSTIPNVLTFGEQAPHYNVNVFRVSARYDF